MSVTADELVAERPGGVSWLWRRQLNSYPDTRPRVTYLAITVLATIMLYYELYVGGSVSTLILQNLGMSFTFFVITLAFGNLIGAFGSLFAGLTDRLGRANLVVFGLLFTGVFVAFILPAATSKWVFTIEGFVVGVVEGICLVATPALIRDFSPQVGRATAMGFWTSGPVMGSLIVAVVGSATVPVVVSDPRFWTHEYRICGIVGLVVFVVALIGLRELSPALRDQLMVTMHDRALIEAKAKGLTEADIVAALRHPFRQLLKTDVVVSAVAVSLMLLFYYTAVGFAVIYLSTVFGFSVKDANGLGNWTWGFNVFAVILIGMVSDRFRVRKPFMLVGGIAAAIMVVIYLLQAGVAAELLHAGDHPGAAVILARCRLHPVDGQLHRDRRGPQPGADGHRPCDMGLDHQDRRLPVVPADPRRDQLGHPAGQVRRRGLSARDQVQDRAGLRHRAPRHRGAGPEVQDAARRGAAIPARASSAAEGYDGRGHGLPQLRHAEQNAEGSAGRGRVAAGGGSAGQAVLTTMCQNATAINDVIKAQAPLQKIAPYAVPLTALSKIPAADLAFLKAHATDVQNAANKTVGQWKTWYWICFGGIIFFICCIPLLRGRWKPSDARKDEEEHEAMVDREMAALKV